MQEARLGIDERLPDGIGGLEAGRLEAVVGVVAAQDERVGAAQRALEVALEELVRLLLAAGHLQRLGELLLLRGVTAREALLGGDAPARAHDERPADADACDGEEQDRRDRDDLAAPERAAAARVDD